MNFQIPEQIYTMGLPIKKAKRALVMLHGRGASAKDILTLTQYFKLPDTTIFAPEAFNNSWYPYSFMAPVEQNQPALDKALQVVQKIVDEIIYNNLSAEKIYFLGFSQGACLTLEYVARNAKKYGGIIAFTGGLIGEKLNKENYRGNFKNTPILITNGDADPHVPINRVKESVGILEDLNSNAILKIFPGRPHTILPEEIQLANNVFSNFEKEINM